MTIKRSVHGELVLLDGASGSATGLIPLVGGAFLVPPYYQRCEQAAEGSAITCRIMSGNPRYTSKWTPIADVGG